MQGKNVGDEYPAGEARVTVLRMVGAPALVEAMRREWRNGNRQPDETNGKPRPAAARRSAPSLRSAPFDRGGDRPSMLKVVAAE